MTVVAHRAFLEAVAARAELDPPDAAKRPAQSVLVGVARRLEHTGRKALESALPSQLATLMHDSAPLLRDRGKTPFLQTVASELNVSPERARFLAQAVLSALEDQDAPTARIVRKELPEDFLDLMDAPGDGPPPWRAATAAVSGPTDLTAEEVSAELASLPGWTGDVRALQRAVAMPPDVRQELLAHIARVEQAMNHHAVVQEQADGTVFRLWTHARGVVTDLDTELARRISDIIDRGE